MSAPRTRLWAVVVVGAIGVLGAPRASAQPASAAPSASVAAPTRPPARLPHSPSADATREKSTPKRAFTAFLEAAEANDFARAAEHLDLRSVPRDRVAREGPELAAMLYRVLSWQRGLDRESLPDEESPTGLGAEGVVLDVVELDGHSFTLSIAPIRQPTGQIRWQFPKQTVAAIRPIYEANERRVVEERVPDWLKQRPVGGLFGWQWLGLGVLLAAAYLIGRVLGAFATALVLKSVARLPGWASEIVRALSRPARLALAAATVHVLLPYLLLFSSARAMVERGPTIVYIVAAAWAAIAALRVWTWNWERNLPDEGEHGLEVRGLRTRLSMLRRVASVIIGTVAAGVVLLQFEVVRSVGVSLLASAGIAGVLVGIAAQRTLGSVIAGIEMSLTQPLRIGDSVVFRPGELGTVEQIFFTFVVVRLWDDRRLVVPVTRVMSEPFENWTRTSGEVSATIELFVDYETPIDRVRAAFAELCRDHELWDRRVCRVDVVDATDKALRIRGTASVDIATKVFDLKSALYEGLLSFLRELDGGKYLPVGRIQSLDAPVADSGASPASPGPTPEEQPPGKRSG